MSIIDARLKQLNITLPKAPAPVASYVPFVTVGNLVFISGQIPIENGEVQYTGRLNKLSDINKAQAAARLCALNVLAHLLVATENNLDRVERCVKIGGFVSSEEDFHDQPKVINGASDLIVQVFGEAGRHSRCAVGVNSLPRSSTVEVDAIFSLKES